MINNLSYHIIINDLLFYFCAIFGKIFELQNRRFRNFLSSTKVQNLKKLYDKIINIFEICFASYN